MSLNAAKAELRSADRSLHNMKTAKNFEIFEEEWRDFLNCIEKTWNKTERGCQSVRNKFAPWQGKFTKERKKDSLLKYVKQARDADNHSIQEVSEIKPGNTTMNFVNPKGGYIESMRIVNGNIVEFKGDPMIVRDNPPTIVALKVKNNGNWYNPPREHKGQQLKTQHPVEIAEIALSYYKNFVADAEEKFF
ncbi:hypothetical protein [Vibrio cyclitrophicus]|jgi:hypothetical protein|uniref:hypothetical protein n=1 Tax=Vibrio cyclitrophicus TaxID=47951 RepID=UPI000CB128C6|nr:hypothetical protein [Vibrio cyclitrophicus]PMI44245.1 hypothetical protein BCU44_17745 [Vibrio cyclitrophicus]